ncbi:hypothetical protein Gotri_005810 [Gossypium trilobum]|uniref:Uncharacterized protein n=1 Tax=Gossypium trilobum TaxID=34281 RepID=A0A7J9EXR5_9ROSI|nr:hypothetical protein [Gossypium trilobum]
MAFTAISILIVLNFSKLISGLLGLVFMLLISLHNKLHLVFALLALTTGSADLCSLVSAIGSLVRFSISGVFVHLIGPNGVFRLLTILAELVLSVRIVLFECHVPNIAYKEVSQKFLDAGKAMWMTLKWLDDSNGCHFLCWFQSFEALGIEDTFFVLLMSIDNNVLRLSSLWILFLVPGGDPSSSILPTKMLSSKDETETKAKESNNIELVSLVNSLDGR